MTPEQLAAEIKKLHPVELVRLNQLLRDLPGWGAGGTREPRRPTPTLDATGMAVNADVGKIERMGGW